MEYEDKVISLLRKDSRLSLKQMAKQAGISRQAVQRRLGRINNEVVTKYTVLPDFRAIGFPVHAMLLLAPKGRKLIQLLEKSVHVNSLYTSSGDFSIIAFALFSDMRKYSDFESEISSFCAGKRVHFIVEEVKQENAWC